MSILGTRVLRIEDPKFLTTGGVYVDDLRDPRLEGAAFVTYVRSAVAHARVTVDATEAAAAPGVVAVVTAADLADVPPPPLPLPYIPPHMRRPWLADGLVRYVGEPVAAVVTESRYAGEDVAELVSVDYDPLPAVIDLAEAAADGVRLFGDASNDTGLSFDLGETDGLFDGCEVVVRRQIVNQRVAPAPLEVRGAACAWGDDGRLTFWASTQSPHGARDTLATALEVAPDQVHFIAPDVGGGFGAKFDVSVEDLLVAVLSRRLGRPLRWTESRTENLLSMGHGRAQLQTVAIGGRRDGTVEAYCLEILQDSGAYPHFGAILPVMTQKMATGVYAIGKVAVRTKSLVTNTASVVAYRGAGRPEATAAIERAMDLFAAEIGMDPAEVRRKNLLPPDAFPVTTPAGAVYDSGEYAEALQAVLDAAGYADLRKEQQRRRDAGDRAVLGIGLSTYVEITAGPEAGQEFARVNVRPDGSAVVYTGTSPHGQGHATSFAMLASEELGIPVERISVVHGDTDLVARGGGTGGSRSLQLGGAAVHQGAIEAVDRAREVAADLFEASPADITLDKTRGGFHVTGSPDEVRSWAEVATSADAEHGLIVDTDFEAKGATFPFGAHLAVVEVDLDTGKVRLVRMVTVDDAGPVINPVIVEGQRHGGIAQGAAQALFEEVHYDADGNPQTTNLADYAFPTAAELPEFELVDMATPSPMNPLGVKGIGEAGTIGATPAVQNAVVDALSHLGVRHVDMPTTSERVWQAINDPQKGGDR
ncbi:MAG TPA: xanthine dehydrogenase family protein molybdopterin-binding subunit [Mycobacteriales bacterium]|nr:xanthine dehydrogenase family protein molybdopterin-binding subunit [Mycobacteriales bacterium]